MATRQSPMTSASRRIASDGPIAGIIVEEDGQEVAHYFSDVRAAREAVAGNIPDALSLAGAWADMDWDEFLLKPSQGHSGLDAAELSAYLIRSDRRQMGTTG